MGFLDNPLDSTIGAASDVTDGTISTVQSGANAGAETVVGANSWFVNGTGEVLDDAGDWTGSAIGNQLGEIGDATTDFGEWTGDAMIGVTEAGSDSLGAAGDGVGGFLSEVLNGKTLLLIGLAVVAAYLIANSDAAEAGASSAGSAAGSAI